MAIHVTCDGCGYQTRVKDSSAGKRGRCPKCGAVVHIPASDEPASMEGGLDLAGLSQGVAVHVERPKPPPPPVEVRASSPRVAAAAAALPRREARPRSSYGASEGSLSVADWLLAIICSGIGCIMGIYWMSTGNPKGGKMFIVSLLFVGLWTFVRFATKMQTVEVDSP